MTKTMPTKQAWTRDRWLALGLAVLVVLIPIAGLAVPAWLLHRHYDFHIADIGNKIARYKRANDTRPKLVEKLDQLKAKNARKYYLKGATSALAGAELQDMVKSTIESNGGRLNTIQLAAPKEEGEYRQVAVNVQISATNPNLRRILHALEATQPYLFVDTLTVRSYIPANFKAAPGFEPDLSIQMDVSAFVMVTPPAPAVPAPAGKPS